MAKRRIWGRVQELPSGKHRARYKHKGELFPAPITFTTKGAADAWLSKQRTAIETGTWVHPDEQARRDEAAQADAKRRAVLFGDYADQWVAQRTNASGEPIRRRTRAEYQRILTTGPLAVWRDTLVTDIRQDAVRAWWSELQLEKTRTMAARSYDLMKSILRTAVDDELITKNPCTIKGASRASTGEKVIPPTDAELEYVIDNMPEHLRSLVVIAAAGGLRYGEATALAKDDVMIERDGQQHVVSVRVAVSKAATYVAGEGRSVGSTKSAAGTRIVSIYGHDAEIIAEHVESRPAGALLWPGTDGGYLSQSSFHHHWEKVREAAGRPDLRFHALRHYAGTRYAQAGATPKETMSRLGHSSMEAAMRYQHSGNRDDELAQRISRRRSASNAIGS